MPTSAEALRPLILPAALRLKYQASNPTPQGILDARSALAPFVRHVFGWAPQPHQLFWANLLQDSTDDLLIIAPPSSAKTSWIGVAYPAWWLGLHPLGHVIYCSNTARQAQKPSVAIRDTIELSQAYHQVFPNIRSSLTQGWGEAEWFLNRPPGDKDASFAATGVGGPILGARADLIIIDDPGDQENMTSHYMRQKAWDWINTTLFSRRQDFPNRTRVIAIMTRWHNEDIASHLIEMGFRTIVMPVVGDDGEALWPEMYPPDILERAKEADPRRFQGMYMCNPTPPEGVIWRGEWWRYYQELPALSQTVQSWDTAFKEGEDWSVCTTWGVGPDGYYLMDMWRQRVEFPQLSDMAGRLYSQWRPNVVLIEDAASGQSLIQVLRQETRIPLLAVKAAKSKEERSWAVVGLAEGGRILLPQRAAWLGEFESEMEEFPNGRHDDIVDSVSQALSHLRQFGEGRLTAGSDFDRALKPLEPETTLGGMTLIGGGLSSRHTSRWAPLRAGHRKA